MTKSQLPRMDKTLKKNSTEVAHSLPLLYITSLTLPLPSIDLPEEKGRTRDIKGGLDLFVAMKEVV